MLLILKYGKTLLRNLVLPPAGPLLLAIIGALLLRRRPRLARVLLALGLGSLWLFSLPVVADALARLSEHYPPLDLAQPTQAQAIVILGGGGQRAYAPEYGGPAAEPVLLERLAYGAYAARRTGLPVLVSGYGIEATAMRDTLARNFGITVRWVDDRAYDTFENARNSAQLLRADGVQRIVLVTSAPHLWRATHEFTATGLEVVPAPAGVLALRETGLSRYLPDAMALLRSYMASYELLGEPVRQLLSWSHLRRQ
ncbi:MAG: YdcF family protein [Steroidobacterales bacterium]